MLASNTSYLDLDAIAAATSRPQDVIGLHFFSPANVMKLMEVVRGTASAPDALATGLAVGRKLKKLPVLTGNAFGFVGNRLYAAYRRQCEFMVEEGAWPEQVDAALEAFGFAMGPFAVADMSGLDIAWRMRQAQAGHSARPGRALRAHRRPAVRSRPPGPQDRRRLLPLCRGRVAAAGGRCGACADRRRRAATRASRLERCADAEIQRRALLALVNEAALLLAEGVAERATDVDVVLVNGYGFPRWEGGPVFWARERGAGALQADLDELAAVSGAGFVRGEVRHLLEEER